MDIITPRLRLLSCSLPVTESVLESNDALAARCGITVPEKWSEFGHVAFKWTLERLQTNPEEQKWFSYLPVLIKANTLIGSCGYKGAPMNGTVEIGYEIAEPFRGNGYAKELAAALIAQALADRSVERVIAHTLAEENASCAILRHCGMQMRGELDDPEDGKIWRWEIQRGSNS